MYILFSIVRTVPELEGLDMPVNIPYFFSCIFDILIYFEYTALYIFACTVHIKNLGLYIK